MLDRSCAVVAPYFLPHGNQFPQRGLAAFRPRSVTFRFAVGRFPSNWTLEPEAQALFCRGIQLFEVLEDGNAEGGSALKVVDRFRLEGIGMQIEETGSAALRVCG